jgi:hypothetical protein
VVAVDNPDYDKEQQIFRFNAERAARHDLQDRYGDKGKEMSMVWLAWRSPFGRGLLGCGYIKIPGAIGPGRAGLTVASA